MFSFKLHFIMQIYDYCRQSPSHRIFLLKKKRYGAFICILFVYLSLEEEVFFEKI